MSKESDKGSGSKRGIVIGIVVIAAICAVALAVILIRGLDSDRLKMEARDAARQELLARQKVQREAYAAYFQARFKRLRKLQKKRAKFYDHPKKAERNLSVAAILVDYDEDGLPEMVIDQPALQYEHGKSGDTTITYDGMYMGNVQVGLYVGRKVCTIPQKPRKKMLKTPWNISSCVYVAKDRRRISVVIRTGGEFGECDGYLYKVTDSGIKEIARKCKVRERMMSETTMGSFRAAPGYKKFTKKFILKDADVYREELSYDKDGNMRHYTSLKKYRKALEDRGLQIN